MTNILCPMCKKIAINILSESGLIGACWRCRDKVIPTYIPEKQHKLFIKLYLRENK